MIDTRENDFTLVASAKIHKDEPILVRARPASRARHTARAAQMEAGVLREQDCFDKEFDDPRCELGCVRVPGEQAAAASPHTWTPST